MNRALLKGCLMRLRKELTMSPSVVRAGLPWPKLFKIFNFMHVKPIIRSITTQNGYGSIPRADSGFFTRGVQSRSLYMRHALWKMGLMTCI